jgi:hypothetical protein
MQREGVLRDPQPPAGMATTDRPFETALALLAEEIRCSLGAGTLRIQPAAVRGRIVVQVTLRDPHASLTRLLAALADAGAVIDGTPSPRTIAP